MAIGVPQLFTPRGMASSGILFNEQEATKPLGRPFLEKRRGIITYAHLSDPQDSLLANPTAMPLLLGGVLISKQSILKPDIEKLNTDLRDPESLYFGALLGLNPTIDVRNPAAVARLQRTIAIDDLLTSDQIWEQLRNRARTPFEALLQFTGLELSKELLAMLEEKEYQHGLTYTVYPQADSEAVFNPNVYQQFAPGIIGGAETLLIRGLLQ